MSFQWPLMLFVCSCMSMGFTRGAFEGYQLIAVSPVTVEQVRFLNKLADDFVDLDFWRDPSPNMTVQAAVPPGLVSIIQERLTNGGVAWKRLDAQLSGMVNAATKKNRVMHSYRSGSVIDVIDHYNYHTYSTIVSYLSKLKAKYPGNVDVSRLTHTTHEGREMMTIKLHGLKGGTKPSIIVEAGIHAREWISPASTLYAIETILQDYSAGDEDAVSMLDSFDWHFVPVTNPDGYEYTHEDKENRLWRKNRRAMSQSCVGVDLNRNFAFQHGTTGVSSNCASLVYPGPKGFSEPETANIRELFKELNKTVVAYLGVHAYSQFLLVPWAYFEGVERPDNWQELDRIANLMATAMYSVDKKTYQVGTVYELLDYAASGSSMDWALSSKPDILSVSYEVRPEMSDVRGFLLPPDEIVATGQELLASFKAMTEQLLAKDD